MFSTVVTASVRDQLDPMTTFSTLCSLQHLNWVCLCRFDAAVPDLSAGIDPRFFVVLHFSVTRSLVCRRSVLSTVTYWNESPCAYTHDRLREVSVTANIASLGKLWLTSTRLSKGCFYVDHE